MLLECTSSVFVSYGFFKKKYAHKTNQNKNKTKTTKQNKNKRKKNPTGSGREEEMKPYWAEVSRWRSREGNCLTQSMKAAQKDKMHRGGRKKKNLSGLPALAWNGCFPSYCQLPCFMLTLHILCCRSTPMLMLAQQNYLLRHSSGNRTAGSADPRAPFQLHTHSHWTHYQIFWGGLWHSQCCTALPNLLLTRWPVLSPWDQTIKFYFINLYQNAGTVWSPRIWFISNRVAKMKMT